MPWKGYNFEDAIVISEKVVREDIFTSIHIDVFTSDVRDTKRGLEELTADIPNVSEESTKDLDENGLIRVGATIREGDILIGKITPKGESDPSPEEKLLRAIFGDKAGDVKDASLKTPPSFKGVVIKKKLFAKAIKDPKTRLEDKKVIVQLDEEFEKEAGKLKSKLIDKLFILVSGKTSQGVVNNLKEESIPKGTKFTQKLLNKIDFQDINPNKWTTDKNKNNLIKILLHNCNIKLKDLLIERIDYHELATQLINSYNLKSKVKIGTGKTFGEYVPEKDLITLRPSYRTIKQFLLTVLHEIRHALDAKQLGVRKYIKKYVQAGTMANYDGLDPHDDNKWEEKAEKFAKKELSKWL